MRHIFLKRASLLAFLVAIGAGMAGCLGGGDDQSDKADPAAEKAITKETADDPVKSMPEKKSAQPASESKTDKKPDAVTKEPPEKAGEETGDMKPAEESSGEKWEVPTGNDPIGSDVDSNRDAMKTEDMKSESMKAPENGDRWLVPTGADPQY